MSRTASDSTAKSNPAEDNQAAGQTTQTPASLLMEFLTVITKHRKFVSRFVLSVTVVVTIVALFLPKWYKSTASVFPAEKSDLLGALDGVSSLAKAFSPARALSSLTGNPEADRYLAILKSGTVLSAVIDSFDLVKVYDITSYPREKTTKELLNNVEFTAETEGNITVTVYDKDPQRAADMANFFVEMLNKTNTEILVQNARANRQFIEERYNKNLVDLAAAEDSLKTFQKKHGIIAMPEQMAASIKAAAEITGQLALKEVEAGVLRRTQSPDHPSVMAAQIEIQELRNKLSQMNRGTGLPSAEMKVFVPFDKVPDLGGEYVRRYRDVEIQYKILQFITPLYEQAKVEERRQTPSVLVLDRAYPAERKSKPKVSLYALLAFVISLILSFFVVFARELVDRLKQTHPERFHAAVSAIRGDWFGLRFRRR
jgi:tyrosine-protein kinase Etk/Wzc